MSIDFLIVGGGIGGAVLANLLGRRGKRVLVLEKNRTSVPQTRPEILWPATVKVLRSLIPEHLEARWMRPIHGLVLTYKRRPLLQFGSDVFRAVGVQPCSTANTRELLMQQAPCDYQRGVEVTTVLRDMGRVVGVRTRDTASGAEREILADWTIGDDGLHSVIRRGCGLSMNLVPFPLHLLAIRFDWPASLPADAIRIWLNEDRVRSGLLGMPAFPLPEGAGVAFFPVWEETLRNERHLQSALRAFVARDPLLGEVVGERVYPHGMMHFRVGWGRKPRFGAPGALLIGDAAHPVTPAGGQGANASVADALAIAEIALDRPTQLLEEYARRRCAAVQRSLSFSRGGTRVLSSPRLVLKLGMLLLPWAARWLNNRPERFGRILRASAEAFQDRP
ncbi:MAG TPA: NAD(P)/FAD-dependent oxidoreductase [Gemmataceae bacterium]|jgi:2-polyprenyl-6-methoxyphenol hydroxylase-like FAD-dependent oxidoreductase